MEPIRSTENELLLAKFNPHNSSNLQIEPLYFDLPINLGLNISNDTTNILGRRYIAPETHFYLMAAALDPNNIGDDVRNSNITEVVNSTITSPNLNKYVI